MPALITALAALPLVARLGPSIARFAGLAARRPALTGAVVGGTGLAAFGAQQALSMGGDGLFRRRRRRRKALSSDDIRIALTIASAISKKAAENFILQRTTRR